MPIVEAVMSATHSRSFPDLAKAIEDAMAAAVIQALADGVSLDDSAELLRRKEAARLAVKDAYFDRM